MIWGYAQRTSACDDRGSRLKAEVFASGEESAIEIAAPSWYPPEDKEAEAERARRQRF